MTRAIKDRDQHCQFYGCTHTHNLQIHHIVHWADGGSTSIENGVCVCAYHHALLHEGGYSIQAVANNQTSLNEQFSQQQHETDASMFNFEKELRNDRESFNNVRRLSPTSYRFRVFDADGRDISVSRRIDTSNAGIRTEHDSQPRQNQSESAHHYGLGPNHSIRVECAEPKPCYYPCRKTGNSYGGGHGRASKVSRSGTSKFSNTNHLLSEISQTVETRRFPS